MASVRMWRRGVLGASPLCSGPLRRLRRHLPRTRGSLPSQSRRPCGRLASSPAGRAKFTSVDRGKLCGKVNSKTAPFAVCTAEGAVFMPSQSRSARQLPRTRGSQNVTFRPGLPRLRERWPAGPERATNNAGASLTADPRRGTLSFVTQKFFCFGAINNRRNYWLGISPLSSQ